MLNLPKLPLPHLRHVKLLHKLSARDIKEGLPLSEVDTKKGPTRQIASVSNLPIVILEMSAAKAQRFDLEKLLPLFDRNSLQTTAIKSNDNRYRTKPFRGAMAFTQNVEQFHGSAQRSRIVSLYFNPDDITPESRRALSEIDGMDSGVLADFRRQLLTRRAEFQERMISRTRVWTSFLMAEGIGMDRVAATHGLVLSGWDALAAMFLPSVDAERERELAVEYILERARAKMLTLNDESDLLSMWFSAVGELLYVGELPPVQNHAPHTHPEEVWLRMSEVKAAFENRHQQWNWAQIFSEFEKSSKVLGCNESKYSHLEKRPTAVYRFARAAFD